jgi:hypothetical protein
MKEIHIAEPQTTAKQCSKYIVSGEALFSSRNHVQGVDLRIFMPGKPGCLTAYRDRFNLIEPIHCTGLFIYVINGSGIGLVYVVVEDAAGDEYCLVVEVRSS